MSVFWILGFSDLTRDDIRSRPNQVSKSSGRAANRCSAGLDGRLKRKVGAGSPPQEGSCNGAPRVQVSASVAAPGPTTLAAQLLFQLARGLRESCPRLQAFGRVRRARILWKKICKWSQQRAFQETMHIPKPNVPRCIIVSSSFSASQLSEYRRSLETSSKTEHIIFIAASFSVDGYR